MLTLSRDLEETVVLRKDGVILAKIKVIRLRRNCVRLGFECPNDVEIIREELLENWRGTK